MPPKQPQPPGARLGAWASPQSEVVAGREVLEDRLRACERQAPGGDLARPPFWGGYRVVPDRFEFWQGRPNRVHDRVTYERSPDGWSIARLSP